MSFQTITQMVCNGCGAILEERTPNFPGNSPTGGVDQQAYDQKWVVFWIREIWADGNEDKLHMCAGCVAKFKAQFPNIIVTGRLADPKP